ncbi:hypothetical protein HAPAU_38080 [Halalkalicoccus paucihalophilus]|uniref:Acyl-CoA dehydrogenase n=1 Tax=Halalkalicoccus paucihalophilus TaxID=1008153 RepID=A0A151A950_9EURY|nr:hypothetical protein [Halalkalicoccus paucihalophilus]KYH24165.1 hypothetical protein HAPAU_38080 [Halalkalicoccus paucihalophilus]
MTSFKSGSGNLDFNSGSESASEEAEETKDESETERSPESEGTAGDTETNVVTEPDPSERIEKQQPVTEYPYFIRRSNVTDERDHRIELHLRREISSQEAAFRNELATELGTDAVPKTDAREFALKFAFQHPERVAALMRDEGFGMLD